MLQRRVRGPRAFTSFATEVDTRGHATALVCDDPALSYADLESRANRLANFLCSLDVGPGSFVGLFLERSETPIIAILACLKAGAAYVPLELMHPDERISFIVAEANMKVILTNSKLRSRLEELVDATVVALDEHAGEIEAQPDRRPSPRRHRPYPFRSLLRALHVRHHGPAKGRDGRTPQRFAFRCRVQQCMHNNLRRSKSPRASH